VSISTGQEGMSSGVAVVNTQCAVNGTLGMLQSEDMPQDDTENDMDGAGGNAAGTNTVANAAAANAAPNATSA